MAEKTITVIPARKRVGSRRQVTEEKPKLRVAAYCRVSTDRDEQESSYEAQVEHYTEFIDRNPEWQLAGIYADDGISGTNTKKREEFNRMILLPLIFIVPMFVSNKTMGVYMAEPIADAIAVTFTAILFSIQFKKALKKLDKA